ncbi:MAG TPA: hypothetical protein VG225_02735 [Terracidiphilus sp.]|jgi:hypothetical protein|nr:hypothetical protein [Terracidiphilus sp.]
MTDETHPIVALTDAGLDALLKRAIRLTLILGAVPALILWIASGWRNAAMLAVGAAISAASILEWQRLIRIFNARLDKQKTPRGAVTAVSLFLLRLLIFAGAIYGSLKCFRGSAIALLCGLALAILAVAWEALRLLRD